MKTHGKYMLDKDGKVIETTDLFEWARFVEDRNASRIAYDELKDFRISTVFLALDYSFGSGPPLLFETMVFKKDQNGFEDSSLMERYTTKEEAIEGHNKILQEIIHGKLHDSQEIKQT